MEHAQKTFKLSVPSDTENLVLIREFVERTAKRSSISDAHMERLKLAVNEACENVIKHAYDNDATQELTIHVWLDPGQLVVDVIDSGRRFDPATHKPLSLPELVGRKGGMGIRLMQLATDEIISDVDEEGHNRLRLIKKLENNSTTDSEHDS